MLYTNVMPNDLNNFRKNIYTNSGVKPCPGYGEDGVLIEIFRQIGVSQKPLCVEFGELRVLGTTTRSFRIKYCAKALYFSGSMDFRSRYLNFLDICKITFSSKNVKFMKFLCNQPKKLFASTKNISEIVRKFSRSNEIDLFVIDIDSFDFEIVYELLTSRIRPRVLVVEYNPSIPKNKSLYWTAMNTKTNSINLRLYGASYEAWEKLMKTYGYSLVHVSGFCNLHYIRGDIEHNFVKPNIKKEKTDTNEKVLLFVEKNCLPGFRPSWLNYPALTPVEIALLSIF